jgi:hypothetical protein
VRSGRIGRVEASPQHNDLEKGGEEMGVEEFENKVKQEVEDRGGSDALKEDATEVKDDVTEEGSLGNKAKDVAEDVKDPGAPGN